MEVKKSVTTTVANGPSVNNEIRSHLIGQILLLLLSRKQKFQTYNVYMNVGPVLYLVDRCAVCLSSLVVVSRQWCDSVGIFVCTGHHTEPHEVIECSWEDTPYKSFVNVLHYRTARQIILNITHQCVTC